MDGSSFGKAMAGIALMAGFGIACAVLLWVLVAPVLLIGVIHAGFRLATGEWYHALGFWVLYSRILIVWLAIHMAIGLVIWWLDIREKQQSATQHADYMRLRKLFYRDDEVCLDSYEALKRRAGEA